jgi:uncharacterized membrane protein
MSHYVTFCNIERWFPLIFRPAPYTFGPGPGRGGRGTDVIAARGPGRRPPRAPARFAQSGRGFAVNASDSTNPPARTGVAGQQNEPGNGGVTVAGAVPTGGPLPPGDPHRRENFSQDFRRFFLRGLAALMPTLITLWLLMKVWEFLWGSIGVYIILGLRRLAAATAPLSNTAARVAQRPELSVDPRNLPWYVQLTGVVLAMILVYLVGLFAGNFIGRTAWRMAERAVMRIPLIRAIYPAVKQVTDFVLSDKTSQFAGTRVVAVEPHAKGIWSIGLVTGPGIRPLSESIGAETITVFVPSSPTAFSGYVLVVPRESVIELPLTVEQAMRLLVSGGVIDPHTRAELQQQRRPQEQGALQTMG